MNDTWQEQLPSTQVPPLRQGSRSLEHPIKQNKCRYFNRGYCKFKENCRFFHSSVICEDFLEIGICKSSEGCIKRHPKNCRYWCKRAEGCRRGENYEFLHLESMRFKDNLNSNVFTEEGLITIDITNDTPMKTYFDNYTNNENNTKLFLCGQCDSSFSLEYLLNEHKNLFHEDLVLTCNECDFNAKKKGGLTRHIN